MSKKTIIIGHKNPDTDSICSALAYSEFKKQSGEKGIIAGRAGNINPQTEFVLNYFKQEAPTFFSDLYPRLSDIMATNPATVSTDTPVLNVLRKFKEERVRFLPVVEEKNKVVGTLVTLDLAERISSSVEPETSRRVCTTTRNIAISTDSKILVDVKEMGEREYSVFVGAMSEESFQKTISGFEPYSLIIIVGDRESILKSAIEKKAGVVVITGGMKPSTDIVALARKLGVCIMSTPYDSASAAWLVKLSVPAGRYCSSEFTLLLPKERVERAKKSFLESRERGIIVADEDDLLQGVVTKSNFLRTPETRLILMDHNELSQAVDGADQVEIIEVVDHHRISFQTTMPISFTIQPVGSTCTLVSEKYRESRQEISKKVAGLLLAAIVSDTVSGRSPTTTYRDIEALNWLEGVSGVNRDRFAIEMFAASSILGQKAPGDVIMNDFKEFTMGKHKVGIGQVEVVGFDKFNQLKDELRDELIRLKAKKAYDLIGLMVTDITYEITLFLVAADQEICDAIGLPEREKGLFEMKGVLSRKKQVVPHMANIMAQ